MIIEDKSVVTIDYELKNKEGEVLDSSDEQGPLTYLQGAQNIIAGLEEELLGKKQGDEFAVEIAAEKAYGMPVDALIQEVPKSAFGSGIDEIKLGMRFEAETEQGKVPVVVTAVEDEMITVDGNHPLAGQSLHFSVNVREVRAASSEELDHGHAHGVGGHHH